MIFSIIVASVFVIGGLVCYASFAASANYQNEEYFYLKMQEMDAERKNKNLKNE